MKAIMFKEHPNRPLYPSGMLCEVWGWRHHIIVVPFFPDQMEELAGMRK